jgi:probable HAF family extracellular repeat protein
MLRSSIVVGVALLLPTIGSAQATYTITNLGTLPGFLYSFGNAINDSGQVAGIAQLPNSSGYDALDHAFFYTGGHIIDIGVLPGGGYSDGYAINNPGQVIGEGSSSSSNQDVFLYNSSAGTLSNLGTPPGSCCGLPSGINESGEIIATGVNAVVYSGGSWTELSVPSGYASTSGASINASGLIAANAQIANYPGTIHAFTYKGGVWTDLGTLPGFLNSSAGGMNTSGQLTGEVSNLGGSLSHAMLYSGGVMTDLGDLPGDTQGSGVAINDFGEIVGDSINGTTGVGRATYYNAITGMVDLNTLIPPGSGWGLNYAAGINRHGQIVGTGSLNGVGLGFVLTPIPSQILINSVLGLIPHLDNCDACGVFLTDLVQQIPESTTNLTPLQKLELGARVDLLVLGVNVFVSQGFVAAGPGDLVVHQAQELLTALRGSNASL